tara:strand:+ start:668 stop:1885 length:1218 start_codon:yes stop_codon:yes gene_type:complete
MQISIKNYFSLNLLLIFSLLVRVIAVFYFGDEKIEYEWSILVDNLYEHGTLALYSFKDELIPSVYMPPLYVFFIFLFKLITPENVEFTKMVLITQTILSTFSIFIFYKLNNFFFSKNWSLFNSFLFSIFPLNIYITTQISSISLQTLLLIIYLYLLFSLSEIKSFTKLKIFFLSLVAGLLMLLRGEFYLIFVLTLIYFFLLKKINLKKTIAILIISLLVISPYIIRNYYTFNKVTLTKSLGFNLWKGNNPYAKVEGSESFEAFSDNSINEKRENLPKDKLYEFHLDSLFFDEGLIYIKENPLLFIERYIKKFFSFFYLNINSEYPNYFHPLFIFPIIFLSIFSTAGIIISVKKLDYKNTYLLLYLLLTMLIFSLFFILPRYKMIILPVQMIYMNYFLYNFFNKND